MSNLSDDWVTVAVESQTSAKVLDDGTVVEGKTTVTRHSLSRESLDNSLEALRGHDILAYRRMDCDPSPIAWLDWTPSSEGKLGCAQALAVLPRRPVRFPSMTVAETFRANEVSCSRCGRPKQRDRLLPAPCTTCHLFDASAWSFRPQPYNRIIETGTLEFTPIPDPIPRNSSRRQDKRLRPAKPESEQRPIYTRLKKLLQTRHAH